MGHFTLTFLTQDTTSADESSDDLAGKVERQLKCKIGDGIAGARGQHGPDPSVAKYTKIKVHSARPDGRHQARRSI